MQVFQDELLRDLARLLHLKPLDNRETGLLLGNRQHRPLHQGIHHAVLYRLGARRRWAGVKEEQGALLLSVVGMFVAVKGEARLRAGNRLRKVGNRARVGRFGDKLDGLGGWIDFLLQLARYSSLLFTPVFSSSSNIHVSTNRSCVCLLRCLHFH